MALAVQAIKLITVERKFAVAIRACEAIATPIIAMRKLVLD